MINRSESRLIARERRNQSMRSERQPRRPRAQKGREPARTAQLEDTAQK
jgi:hypothetical protein